MPKKILTIILICLLIITIPFILYFSNFKVLLYDEDYYNGKFQKHNVYENLEGDDIELINKDVLDYFRNKDELIKNDFFNEKEKSHLSDVKKLINGVFYLFNLSIIIFIVSLIILFFLNKNKFIKNLGLSLAIGGALTFLDAFFFWLIIKINFDKLFTWFHKLFFEDNWMFNSLTNNIVVLYSQNFFFDFTYDIVIRTLILAFILGLIGLILFLKSSKK